MDRSWVLRSPHSDGVHLLARTVAGTHDSLARLVHWRSSVDVVDATVLPAGLRDISWSPETPLLFAACSADKLFVIDLSHRSHPRRIRLTHDLAGNARGVAWARDNVLYACDGTVGALDVETGDHVWRCAGETSGTLASLASVSAHELVASWHVEETGSSGPSGVIHILDIRSASKVPIVCGTSSVHGLCASPLDQNLVASYTDPTAADAEVHVWDIRRTGCLRSGGPVRRVHARTTLSLGRLQSVEWSPAKHETLLALSSDSDSTLFSCRLWQAPTENEPDWLGQAQVMRPTALDSKDACGTGGVVAAGWAHASRPGAVLALHSSGALMATAQRGWPLCAWSSRGGALIVRQLPARPSTFTPAPATAAPPGGVSPVASLDMERSRDIVSVMRSRAEQGDYGVKMGYDECSRVARSTGNGPANEALATAWQWAKTADQLSTSDVEGRQPRSWSGVKDLLDKGDGSSKLLQPIRGIEAFSSGSRLDALQALGFPEIEPACTSDAPPADDVIRRILRAVVWLQFERAATECELLQPADSHPLLFQLMLVFHAASCLIQKREDKEDWTSSSASLTHVQSAHGAPTDPAHAFRATLQRLLLLDWELPSSATLRLALRFVEVVVTNSTLARTVSALTFQEEVVALLTWSPSASRSPTALHDRPDVAFRCALALRYLPQPALELNGIVSECRRGGLLDGLCVLGLGGGEDATPISASMLDELVEVPANPRLRTTAAPPLTDDAALVGAYVERSGDVQSAALLFCYAAHLAQPPDGLRRFLVLYAALLTRWQLHRQRAGLHSLLAARLPPDSSTRSCGPKLYCYSCNRSMMGTITAPPGSNSNETILRRCPNVNCGKAAPACAVCLLPVCVVRSDDRSLSMGSWLAWCQQCHHGGHVEHLEEWFDKHIECPVAGCDCQCALY